MVFQEGMKLDGWVQSAILELMCLAPSLLSFLSYFLLLLEYFLEGQILKGSSGPL